MFATLVAALARPRVMATPQQLTCVGVRMAPRRRRFCAGVAMSEQEFVAGLAFDLETTGLDTNSAEIVQLAVVIANSKQDAKFSRLVLPEGDIDPGASSVHGFTREVLEERGARPFGEVWAECEAWLRETLASDTRPLVWAAHNGAQFDQPILRRCVVQATGGESACDMAVERWESACA